ncbi:M43 family zinc metalloprotease [Hymenobacter terrenus]|uniref:M43 family zinc metalloprotease n=1 Tax=Hymenobacter terrenus TaxID=1629124 RepID=UPI001E3BE8A8|nr:M43 family zinc metalloprotease [Hymenobacter terrenus]
MKKLLPSVLTAALALTGFGASAQASRGANWCGTTALQAQYYAEHPGAREAEEALYKRVMAIAQGQPQQRGTAAAPDVVIPVVVHVIHAGGADNITDRQINSGLDQLNIDYQKLNSDTITISPLFRPIAASIGFSFRLAKKDPNGNCTTGITRHYAPNLVNDDQTGAVQALSVWDQSRYLNIWLVNSIGVASGSNVTIGYVSPPNAPSNPRDGFVVRQDYFGDIGTSNPTNASLRAATHEIGHYFGLRHPWGPTNNPGTGSCTGDDLVSDTPPTDGTFNCNLSYAPCGQIANVQNFMDYASCANMFTQGQKTLMRNLLTAVRSNLTTPANLISTGTNDGYVAPNCAPIAAFAPAPGSSLKVCVNTNVTLRDYSSNFTAAGGTLTYNWSFPGGNPSTATGQTATVSYPTAGFYPVTETVTNTVGSSTSTVTNYIRVEGPTGGETAPVAQSFETSTFPALFPEPTLRNYETFGTTSANGPANYRWARQATLPAADGNAYVLVSNRVYPPGAITTLITPNINLTAAPNPAVLSFARAFALRSATSNEQLRISFSSDCGVTWSTPTVLDVTALTTRGLTPTDGYIPAASNEWQRLNVPIPAQFQGSGLFKVRLQMVNGTTPGNNFYLDDLRIGSAVLATKADALASRGISVYPNPLTKETAVHLNLPATTQVQVRLTDVLGRDVLTLPAKTYGAGQQAVSLQSAGQPLQAGVYVVRISLDGETFTSKLTVE